MSNHTMMLQFSTTVMKVLLILCLLPGELLSDTVAGSEHNIDVAATNLIHHHRINKRSHILNEPTILVLGENVENPRIGDTVTLHCNVDMPSNSEPVFVKWTFGSSILTHDENLIRADPYRFNIIKSQETMEKPVIYTLINNNVIESDFGEYRCVVGYDAYGTGHSSMQMWAKIVINRPINNFYRYPVETLPNPKCTAEGGVLDFHTWIEGQNIVVNCQIDAEIPNMNLEWTWISDPGYHVKPLNQLQPYVENGTTSVYFQITANEVHGQDVFVCTLSHNYLQVGEGRNCSIGPITVRNNEPTSKPIHHSLGPEISGNVQTTSSRPIENVTRSIGVPSSPSTNYAPVIVVGLILGLMATVLLVITIFLIWLRKTRPHGFQSPKSAKRTTIATFNSTSGEYSSPSSRSSTLPSKPKLENKLSDFEEHKYDVIHELNHYDSVHPPKGKVRAVAYAITEIQSPEQDDGDDEVQGPAYATVWRESPDGASVSSEGFVDNIIYASSDPNEINQDVESAQIENDVHE